MNEFYSDVNKLSLWSKLSFIKNFVKYFYRNNAPLENSRAIEIKLVYERISFTFKASHMSQN